MTAITILDGGTGGELQERRLVINGSIWSALALIEQPGVVQEIHEHFIRAGAQVITTSNYSVVPSLLAIEGEAHRFEELTRLAAECAGRARTVANPETRIAGSLPPLHHSYRPDQVGAEDDNVMTYTRIVEWLSPAVDLFLCETMSTGLEARAAVRAAQSTNKPVWVAWTLDDEKTGVLRSGETIEEAYALLEGLRVDTYLFNCSSPESITTAIPRLRAVTDQPVGAYANAFGREIAGTTTHTRRKDLEPDAYGAFARQWVQAGATVVGGCCGIGPAHIEWLHQNLA